MNGYFDAGIYVLTTALSFVFLDHLIDSINPITVIFIMSGIGIVVFNFFIIGRLKHTYLACRHNITIYLLMAGALALEWASLLSAIYVADPFVSMASLFTAAAIVGFCQVFIKTKIKLNLLSVILLSTGLMDLYFSYKTKVNHSTHTGVMLGLIAGISFYIYMAASEKLTNNAKLSSFQILSVRFWPLFIGAGIFMPKSEMLTTISNNWFELIGASFGSIVIPIYFSQQAINKLGTKLTAIIVSLVPPTTYLIYIIYNHQFSAANTTVCMILTLALIIPKFAKFGSLKSR